MATGKLILHDDVDSFDRKRVYIKFSHKGKVALVSTPEKINPDHLDKDKFLTKKLRVTNIVKLYGSINERLSKLEFLCTSILEKFIYINPSSFTVDDIKRDCLQKITWKEIEEEKQESWLSQFNKWMKYRQDEEAADEKTIYNYTSTRNVFLEYLTSSGSEQLSILQVTGQLLNKWIKSMLANQRDPATIKKHISIIRKCCCYYKHAEIRAEWKPSIPLKIVKKQGVAFTVEEIRKMYIYEPDQPEVYQPIKDLLFRFIASGVRWSDQDIQFLQQGQFIPKRNHKNQNISYIPLNRYLIEVLDKPKPVMSIKHFNKYVKKFCEKAGIDSLVPSEKVINGKVVESFVPKWKRVSSKIGRKSLVSLLTAAGFNEADIRKIIGNNVELEAYQVVDLEALGKKVREDLGGVMDLS